MLEITTDEELKFYTALWLMPGFSKSMWRALLKKDIVDIRSQLEFLANLEPKGHQKNIDKLTNIAKLARVSLEDLTKLPYYSVMQQHLNWLEQSDDNFILTYKDFPKALQQIKDPPILLCGKGNYKILNENCLAIVGSRRPSINAQRIAFDFAAKLAEKFIIVSGLALGIDANAHKGALTSGKTIGVMATGIEQIYPKTNINLAKNILEKSGAIITEMPLNTPPLPSLFPIRNRIITGLSLGTFVVEASLKSGSLISARLANEAGRCVYAAPSSLNNPQSAGTNKLLQDGATMVLSAEDIIADLEPQIVDIKTYGTINSPNRKKLEFNFSDQSSKISQDKELKLDKNLSNILNCLDTTNIVSTDDIYKSLDMDISQIKVGLQELELLGYVQQTSGGWIKLV